MGLTKLYAADTLAVMVLNKGAIKCPVLLHFSIYLRFLESSLSSITNLTAMY